MTGKGSQQAGDGRGRAGRVVHNAEQGRGDTGKSAAEEVRGVDGDGIARDDMRLRQRLEHDGDDVAAVAEVETREENAVRERAGHARDGGNAHRQARETEHGRERHRAERGGADHFHDAAEQEAHDDGNLLFLVYIPIIPAIYIIIAQTKVNIVIDVKP